MSRRTLQPIALLAWFIGFGMTLSTAFILIALGKDADISVPVALGTFGIVMMLSILVLDSVLPEASAT